MGNQNKSSNEIAIQHNGSFVKYVAVLEDASRSTIEKLAFEATGTSRLNARVVIVPGKLANVLS